MISRSAAAQRKKVNTAAAPMRRSRRGSRHRVIVSYRLTDFPNGRRFSSSSDRRRITNLVRSIEPLAAAGSSKWTTLCSAPPEPADLDRPARREAAVGVHQLGRTRAGRAVGRPVALPCRSHSAVSSPASARQR